MNRIEMIRSVGRLFVIGVVGTTIAVALDVAVPERLSVRAVTSTLRRKPRSAMRTPYVLPVAPMTFAQVSVSTSQRCHWKANEVGLPVHVPSVAVSSFPTRASPLIVGRPVFVSGAAFEPTTSVCSERAFIEPSAFTAVTRTRSVLPTSACPTLYVLPSDASSTQLLPPGLQRNQRYRNSVGLLSHVPFWAVSTSP